MASDELIAGRFQLLERAAVGGMGTVYRGLDQETQQPVAVKILKHKAQLAVDRFSREAAVLGRLKHPRIVEFIGSGVTEGGRHYIISEWLHGVTLKERLLAQGLDVHESIEVVLGTAEAISQAHEFGLVHRDVKPSNIFLVNNDPANTKVLDFGVVRDLEDDHQLTQTGTRIGTPGYMAPEQARGQKVDRRADVWSMGCVLYESLSGYPAFVARNPLATRMKVIVTAPPPITTHCPDLPGPLVDLLGRMLNKNPEARPASAREVVEALQAIRVETRGRRRKVKLEASSSSLESSESTRSFEIHPGSRLQCIVMAAQRTHTSPTALSREDFSKLREAAATYQGSVNFIDVRGASYSLSSANAHECALRACRLALTVSRLTAQFSVAVAASWEAKDEDDAADRSIEWCGDYFNSFDAGAIDTIFCEPGALDGGAPGGVLIDSLTAELVADAFVIEKRGRGYAVIAKPDV